MSIINRINLKNKMEFKNQLNSIKETLTKKGLDYQNLINLNIGVINYQKRENGYKFQIEDHLKGLIYSLLSNQRPWKKIAENLELVDNIFLNYDPNRLKKITPDELITNLRIKQLGNRAIARQMNGLKNNIITLENIQREYGSIDKFIESDTAEVIAGKLSNQGKYKIENFGFALAMEYLKNVGISGAKPDVHIIRICDSDRLNVFKKGTSGPEIQKRLYDLCKQLDYNLTEVDYILWLFAAKGYGEICESEPNCDVCLLKERQQCNLNRLETK